MDVVFPDSWLRDFLKTKAKPLEIAKYVSLCGPSVEKVERKNGDHIYFVEITTNRVDSAGIFGFAKEAATILPGFGLRAKLLPPKIRSNQKIAQNVDYLQTKVDHHLCYRFTAILIKNIQIANSPEWFKKRLEAVNVRPINNVVDISNYVMHELGQPVHTFDYDKIKGAKMILRESKKGEKLTTLDGKEHDLPQGVIVIEDGNKRLIDLCGIMGGENSAVDEKTKNVLLFVQTYNPARIRHTSMALAQRSEAASLFEKDLDPELVTLAIRKCIDLFVELTKGKPSNKILDLYPQPYKSKIINTNSEFIESKLGIKIAKDEISKILNSLGFVTKWNGKNLSVTVPSSRAKDVSIPEDIVEEIARIHGYYNLPSNFMAGKLPAKPLNPPFKFETFLKNILTSSGAYELYTLSLVPKSFVENNALHLKNPLGEDTKYLRTNLRNSLADAAKQNSGATDPFHLFEIANVYLPAGRHGLPQKGGLPEEKMMLAGIFANTDYRSAKGAVESLLDSLNTKIIYEQADGKYFKPAHRLEIKTGDKQLGLFGVLENDYLYYEFEVEALRKVHKSFPTYKPIPKYPAQIEDITLVLPERTKVGEVVQSIKAVSKLVENAELIDIYKDSYTFRINYQDAKKTLTDREVEKLRNLILKKVKRSFGAIIKR